MTFEDRPVFRFAPSPNGRLHPGHAYSAVLNAQLAEKLGGRFLVRLEDIDLVRCTPEHARHCLADLAWLGLRWEEPVRRQSEHFADYGDALRSLRLRDLLYPCFCTRRRIAEAALAFDPDGAPLYAGCCAGLPPEKARGRIEAGEAHGWRLRMARAQRLAGPLEYRRFDPSSMAITPVAAQAGPWGDVILARKEMPTSYHLSVVVDDALQEITHVVRGVDLEAATALHVLLQKLLGLGTPLYHHHALWIDGSGAKLSKSRRSETLADLRAQGVTAAEIRQRLAL